jgi:hypothetical protein
MKVKDWMVATVRSCLFGAMLALAIHGCFTEAEANPCTVPSVHAGIAFPVQHLEEDWACRVKVVIERYTTATSLGPLKTAMDETMYFYLLDRPPVAAALINRLDLAEYKAEARGPDRWWGNDGEGSEGMVHLIYHDSTTRIYYLEGTHRSRLLPNVSGKAVVFLRVTAVKEAGGLEAMQNTLVAYTMVDNRFLSGLATLLRPLIGATVNRKLARGLEVVNRLGVEMRQRPERVLFEAMDPPPLTDEEVAFLKKALSTSPPQRGRSGHATP